MAPILGLKISPKNAKGETVQPAKGDVATVTVSDLDKLPDIAAMEEAGAAPPQPAREAASTTPARETMINCLQRIK